MYSLFTYLHIEGVINEASSGGEGDCNQLFQCYQSLEGEECESSKKVQFGSKVELLLTGKIKVIVAKSKQETSPRKRKSIEKSTKEEDEEDGEDLRKKRKYETEEEDQVTPFIYCF